MIFQYEFSDDRLKNVDARDDSAKLILPLVGGA